MVVLNKSPKIEHGASETYSGNSHQEVVLSSDTKCNDLSHHSGPDDRSQYTPKHYVLNPVESEFTYGRRTNNH